MASKRSVTAAGRAKPRRAGAIVRKPARQRGAPSNARQPTSPAPALPSAPDTVLADQLAAIEASGLVQLLRTHPEFEYIFRHALVQEAAYASLLKQSRRTLHLTIGQVLERVYPERLDELAPVLAHHFAEGDAHERAQTYFERAGDLATRQFANAEASLHYRRALDLATSNGAPDTTALPRLLEKLGRALELAGRYEDALAHYQAMESLARARADRALELAALIARSIIHSAPTLRFDPEQAQAISVRALALARELGDQAAEAKLLWHASLVQKFLAHWVEHVRLGEQALQIARNLQERELLAYVLNDIGQGLATVGQTERARAALDEAESLWRVLDNTPMLLDNRINQAYVSMIGGRLVEALALAQDAHLLSHSTQNLWGVTYSAYVLGMIFWESGEAPAAVAAFEEVIRLGTQSGFALVLTFGHAMLALTYVDLGSSSQALKHANMARAHATDAFRFGKSVVLAAMLQALIAVGENDEAERLLNEARDALNADEMFTRALLADALAEWALAKGDFSGASAIADEMIPSLRRTRVSVALPRMLLQKARALLAQDRTDEAYDYLQEALHAAEQSNQRPLLWRILTELIQLAERRGDEAQAAVLRLQVRPVIEFLAEHAPTPELGAAFLARPTVRSILRPERTT